MAETQYRKACTWCGSENVTHDALARWNEVAQEWEISSTLDNADCDRCGGECDIEDVPMDYDPWAFGRPLNRVLVREVSGAQVFRVFHYAPGVTTGEAALLDSFGRADDADQAAKNFASRLDDAIVVLEGEEYP